MSNLLNQTGNCLRDLVVLGVILSVLVACSAPTPSPTSFKAENETLTIDEIKSALEEVS